MGAICGKWKAFFSKVVKGDEGEKDPEWDLSKEMYKEHRLFFLMPPSPPKSKMKEFFSCTLKQIKQNYS